MSYTPMDLRNYTVPQLREIAKEVGSSATGLSKMRKAELIDFIVAASEANELYSHAEQAEQELADDSSDAVNSTEYERIAAPDDLGQKAEPEAVPFVSQDDVATNVADALPSVTVPALGTFDANEFLAFVGSRLAAPFTPQDRADYDMAKYRGRYEGKRALVEIGTERVHGEIVPRYATGTIVAGSSRRELLASDLETGNGTLVLTVRHDELPRATMHRAEDVVLF